MNYRPLGQGLAGAFLLAHATLLWAAASDAIIVESRSESLLVCPWIHRLTHLAACLATTRLA
jgi:hypothetical protein